MQLLLCLLLCLLHICAANSYRGWGITHDIQIVPNTAVTCIGEANCYYKFETVFNTPLVEFVCFTPKDDSDCHLIRNTTVHIEHTTMIMFPSYYAFGIDYYSQFINGTEFGVADFVNTFNAECDYYLQHRCMFAWCLSERWRKN